MVNMVDAVCSKAAAFAGRWLRVAVLMVFIFAGVAAAWARRLESSRSGESYFLRKSVRVARKSRCKTCTWRKRGGTPSVPAQALDLIEVFDLQRTDLRKKYDSPNHRYLAAGLIDSAQQCK